MKTAIFKHILNAIGWVAIGFSMQIDHTHMIIGILGALFVMFTTKKDYEF